MIRTGFITIPRAVFDAPWFIKASPLTRALWLLFLMHANWAPGTTRRGLELRPGQLVTSWATLAELLSHAGRGGCITFPPLTNIRRAAAFLKRAGEVTWCRCGKAAGDGIVVTLERWPLYASPAATTAGETADSAAEGYAVAAAPLEQEDLPPAVSRGKTLTHQEQRRLAIEETKRMIREEQRLRRGNLSEDPDELVH